MRLLVFTVAFGMLLGSCQQVKKGNGNVASEHRDLPAFHSVKSSGIFELVLVKGDPAVMISADENLHEYIKTEVKNGQLLISSDQYVLDAEELKVVIHCDDLEDITISGAAKISAPQPIDANELTLHVSGAAEADLTLQVNYFEVNLSGGAEIKLRGSAKRVNFDLSGAADVDASELRTSEAKIIISGAGEVSIIAERVLDVNISGAGEVNYWGDPEITQSISGAGQLNKKE
jgi:hypothetical protein